MEGTSPSRGCGGSRQLALTCHDGVSKLHHNQRAKNVFAIHGVDEAGKAVLVKSKVSRDQLVPLIAQFPP
ncbi:hypothetical protein [Cupriavidus sp. UYPR2.512]|uniref:hypothetical protein n=1 Tax=Cupriavidus sp. UYPR2.512 TaxID=1080187 RepID=UPI0012F8D8E7|nr:hypothetical protein [Cupriavidus sp. UYPR2.512]